MICSFNGQDSQPIQPLLKEGRSSFNLEKNHLAVALSHVMSETIAGQCTPHRRWMLRSKLLPVYFPNTIAKVSNSTVKSNTLVVFVCACACVCVRVLPSTYPVIPFITSDSLHNQ